MYHGYPSTFPGVILKSHQPRDIPSGIKVIWEKLDIVKLLDDFVKVGHVNTFRTQFGRGCPPQQILSAAT